MRWVNSIAAIACCLVGLADARSAQAQERTSPGPTAIAHVTDNATLKAASTLAYPSGVWRDDYASGHGAPPLFYKPGGAACSFASGTGDNGSQVSSADHKCWLAVFPTSGIDIREFGADPTGVADSTVQIQAAIDATYRLGLQRIACPIGNYKITSPLYLDPPGNLRSNWSNPTNFNFSLTFSSEGRGNLTTTRCSLNATFNNTYAFVVGPGQQMKVQGISVVGPQTAYRGNQPSAGVGIGIAGGQGGAHDTLVSDTLVAFFYTDYKTNVNGACCLADDNTFERISAYGSYIALLIDGSQNDVNTVIDPVFNATVGISNPRGRDVLVLGGNNSPTSSRSNAFAISSVSDLAKIKNPDPYYGGVSYQFTAVVDKPDVHIPKVYNAYTIATTHFGIVPVVMSAWNAGTHTGTFYLEPHWVAANYGGNDLTSVNTIGAEIKAVPTLYAVERTTLFQGSGINVRGGFSQNTACLALLDVNGGGDIPTSIRDYTINGDPAMTFWAPATKPTPADLAQFYCAQTYPVVVSESNSSQSPILLDNITFGQTPASHAPLIFESALGLQSRNGTPVFTAKRLIGLAPPNLFVSHSGSVRYRQRTGPAFTQASGYGFWDSNYFSPHAASGVITNTDSPSYCGVHPCGTSEIPLTVEEYSTLTGALGALGSYGPVDCEAVYRVISWNSGALAHLHARSASCPGYSYGQTLTNSLVGGTIAWSYKGGSDALYLDPATLSWMFPGLALTLPGGYNSDPLIITGVYPQLGYVTVMDAASESGAPLPGASSTVYSCSSGSCTIGQAPYSWTQY